MRVYFAPYGSNDVRSVMLRSSVFWKFCVGYDGGMVQSCFCRFGVLLVWLLGIVECLLLVRWLFLHAFVFKVSHKFAPHVHAQDWQSASVLSF